ncbi:MAG: hypothetical protein QOJ89_2938 [bacterium]|jgi:hypothetical protein
MEIQTFPACERNADSYTLNPEGDPVPRENINVAGLPGAIFDGGQRVEVYMRTATVVIFGGNPGQIRRAANQLKRPAKLLGQLHAGATGFPSRPSHPLNGDKPYA